MTDPKQPDNIKTCPECGASLIQTAHHCPLCGCTFPEPVSPAASAANAAAQAVTGALTSAVARARERAEKPRRKALTVTISLPLLVILILGLLAMNTVMILGWQQRDITKTQVAAVYSTATWVVTSYVTQTHTATPTVTPPPPTATEEPEITYTTVSGDSCLSIATRYKISLNDLVLMNKDLDCSLLKIGVVLKIPHPTATPEPSTTPGGTETPSN